MANDVDEITAEYKKLRKTGPLGDNDLSISDRLLESIFGKYEQSKKNAEKVIADQKERESWKVK